MECINTKGGFLKVHFLVIVAAFQQLFHNLGGDGPWIGPGAGIAYSQFGNLWKLIHEFLLINDSALVILYTGGANVSWGRYWGWDPKEVWALITMLVYALALHPASLHYFRRPLFFHLFSIVAFLTVLITYFGVNFLLGGMHSYAG